MNERELRKAMAAAWKRLKAAEKEYSRCLRSDPSGASCGLLQERYQHAQDAYKALERRVPG